jgi:hypothetical protein
MRKSIFSRVIILFVAVSMAVASAMPCAAKKKDKSKIETYEQAVARFNEVFGLEAGWDKSFEVYPDNRFYVDVKNQKLCFVTNGKKDTVKWAFTPPTGTLKAVRDSDKFAEWAMEVFKLGGSDIRALFEEIDTEYKDRILSASASDADKVFSMIYNSLLGDSGCFLTAYINEEGTWTKVRNGDYPQRTLDKKKFIEAVASIDDKLTEGMDAYKFLNDNHVFGRAEVFKYCYWNLREDKFYVYPDGKYSMKLSSGQSVVADKAIESIAATVLDNPDKVYVMVGSEVKDLDSFYKDSTVCLNLDVAYLSSHTYVKPEGENGLVMWILIGCAVVVVCVAGALLFIFREKIFGKKKSGGKPEGQKPQHHDDPQAAFVANLKRIAESEHPSAAEVLKVFDKHFKTGTRDTLQKIINERSELAAKVEVLDSFKAKVQDGQSSTKALLHEVDILLQDRKTKYEKAYDDDVAKMGTYSKKYHDFVHLVSEGAVMENLDAIRKEHPSFPEVKTVNRLVKKAKGSSTVITEQIDALLREADLSMLGEYQALVKDAAAYVRVGNVFRNNDTGLPHDYYLQSLVDNALGMDELLTVDKYIEFALNFKASNDIVDGQIASVAKATKEKFNAIDNALEAWSDATAGIMSADTLKYWERLAYFLALASTSKVLYKAYGQDNDEKIATAVESFKNDIVNLYLIRYFIQAAQNSDVTSAQFKDEYLVSMAAKVNEFNVANPHEIPLDVNSGSVRASMELYIDVVRKLRHEEQMTEIFTLMWDRFVKEFHDQLRDNRDKGWLVGNSVQMSLYLIDVLRHVIAGSDECYCSNYTFLKTGEPTEGCKDFCHNHIELSDKFTNFIYGMLEECGASDIDLILNNLRIKM